jgi:hypothetical protein
MCSTANSYKKAALVQPGKEYLLNTTIVLLQWLVLEGTVELVSFSDLT